MPSSLFNRNISLAPITIFLFGVINYFISYAVNVFLANYLSVSDFNDFSVSLALISLCSNFATLGLEKYALRSIALNIEHQRWARLNGFWKFSMRIITLFSVLMILIVFLNIEYYLEWKNTSNHLAIMVCLIFLPSISLSLFLIEILTVLKKQAIAIAIYRVFIPVVFFGLMLVFVRLSVFDFDAVNAMVMHGLSWCVALLILWKLTKENLGQFLAKTNQIEYRALHWLKKSTPLLVSGFSLTVIANSGTIVLEAIYPDDRVVGLYAVIVQIISLITIFGTSTNRYYLPQLVVAVELDDVQKAKSILQERSSVIGSALIIMITLVYFKGCDLLSLFGEDFSSGSDALNIAVCGAAIMTMYSYIPYQLQFMGCNKLVIYTLLTACLSTIVLSYELGESFGGEGVALAYTLTNIVFFAGLKTVWQIKLRKLTRHKAPSS